MHFWRVSKKHDEDPQVEDEGVDERENPEKEDMKFCAGCLCIYFSYV